MFRIYDSFEDGFMTGGGYKIYLDGEILRDTYTAGNAYEEVRFMISQPSSVPSSSNLPSHDPSVTNYPSLSYLPSPVPSLTNLPSQHPPHASSSAPSLAPSNGTFEPTTLCPGQFVSIDIKTDTWPSETSWDIT